MKLFFAFVPLALVACASHPRSSSSRPQKTQLPPPVMAPRQKIPDQQVESSFVLGNKLYAAKDYARAFDYYMTAALHHPASARETEAKMGAQRAATKLGRWSEAFALADDVLNANPAVSMTFRLEVLRNRLVGLEATGDFLRFISSAQALASETDAPSEKEALRLKSLELINTKLAQGDLEALEENTGLSAQLRSAVQSRLGDIAVEARDQSSAVLWYERAVSTDAASDSGRHAQATLEQIQSMKKVEAKTIGVVLPLTGKHATIAQKTLRGIQLGLGLNGKQASTFRLAVVDDEANPDRARQGVERLVKEDNVIGVIGSLVSKTAPAVASKSSELGVPSVALSQKSGLTEIDPHIYRNALTSEMQIRWLVRQAIQDLGMKRFAVVYPNDPYGVEFTNLFWDEVLAQGGQITAAQSYSPKETDFRFVVQRLVGTFYSSARDEEFRLRSKEKKDSPSAKSLRQEHEEDLLPALVDFDAIFIPDSAKALGQIAAMLSFHGVKGVRLLGTNLWNVPGLAKRAGNWTKDLLFVDSFVGTDPLFQSSEFVREYRALFNEDPGIFEMQGYDSAVLLRTLISQGASSREALTLSLAQAKNIPGALAPLSMNAEHEVNRPLTTLTLDNGKIVPYQEKTTP